MQSSLCHAKFYHVYCSSTTKTKLFNLNNMLKCTRPFSYFTQFSEQLPYATEVRQYLLINKKNGKCFNYSFNKLPLAGHIKSYHVLHKIDQTGNILKRKHTVTDKYPVFSSRYLKIYPGLLARKGQNDSPLEGKSEKRGERKDDYIWTIPNALTASRIIMSPIIGYLVLQESYSLSFGLFLMAGITDLLDGWIARKFPRQMSAIGSFIDPLADKILVSVLFLSLTFVNLIPLPLAVIVVLRDVGLIAAAFYVRYISLIPPITLTKFFDVTNATAQLKPMFISKVNTALQLGLVTVSLAAPIYGYVDHTYLHVLWYLTAVTTTTSGIGYMFAKDTFKIF